MSPLVIGARSSPSANAAGPETSPTPAVIAPAATMPFFKNDRRFLRPLNAVSSFFISFSYSRIESSVSNARSHTCTPAGKPASPASCGRELKCQDHGAVLLLRLPQLLQLRWDSRIAAGVTSIIGALHRELTVESDAALRDHPVASVHCRILGKGACHSEVKLLSSERTICIRGNGKFSAFRGFARRRCSRPLRGTRLCRPDPKGRSWR